MKMDWMYCFCMKPSKLAKYNHSLCVSFLMML